jgi:hemerythrin
MALLQWDDDFATGVPAADHEHDKMIGLINSVHGRWLKKGNGNWPALCDELLDILFDHFRFEDQIMRGSAYAGQEAHAHDHDRIVKELRRIRARADETRFDMASALASCLQRWLAEHIRHHDAPLYRSLAPAF